MPGRRHPDLEWDASGGGAGRDAAAIAGEGGRAAAQGEAFPKLADFLRQLEDRRAAHQVSAFHQEAIRVEVVLREEKWVVTFFPDGRLAVEVFSASGAV